MSEPRTDRDMDQMLTAWMDAAAPERTPSRLLEETFASTMKSRQLRAWPWHRVTFGPVGRTAGSGAGIVLFAIVALVVLAMVVGLGGGRGLFLPPLPTESPTPTASAAPSPVLPTAIVVTPEATLAMAAPGWPMFDGTSLWIFSGDGLLSRIDPATNKISAPRAVLDPGTNNSGEAIDGAGLWVSSFDSNLVYRIDPASFTVVAKIPVGASPEGLSVGADAVWVANLHGGSVTRINPATNKVVATVIVNSPGPGGPHAVGRGFGSVWVSAGNLGSGIGGPVVRIDPATNLIQATIPMPPNASACGGFVFTADSVWMDSCFDQRALVRIDPTSNTVATIPLAGFGDTITLIDGVPWLRFKVTDAGPDPARLIRIDPATNTVDRVISVGEDFKYGGMLVAAGSVWVSDGANNQLFRLPLAAFAP